MRPHGTTSPDTAGRAASQPLQPARGRRRLSTRLVGAGFALTLLAAPAAACPYCALSQGADTLLYILAFLGIPYVIVAATWFFMRRLLAEERAEQESGEDAGRA